VSGLIYQIADSTKSPGRVVEATGLEPGGASLIVSMKPKKSVVRYSLLSTFVKATVLIVHDQGRPNDSGPGSESLRTWEVQGLYFCDTRSLLPQRNAVRGKPRSK
jgi:hypothetical protein